MSDAAVWIDPARRSGDPCIGGTRLPVDTIIEAAWRNGVPAAIDTWEVTRAQVLGACWYAATYGTRRWRKRWHDWATVNHGAMWGDRYDDVPDPPRSQEPA